MIKVDQIDILKLLPFFLQQEKDIQLICQIVQEEIDIINQRESNIFTYGWFESLDEAVLDELAYQWKTEGYEQTLPKDTKAKLVEVSYIVRKTKGTSYAVEKTVQDIHGDFDLLEWFKGDLDPYHFKIVGTSAPPGEKLKEIYKVIEMTKNERSYLEGILVSNQWEGNTYHGITIHQAIYEEIPFSDKSIMTVDDFLGG